MKIRTGFVSNSSSSSFILIVEREIFDKEFFKIEFEPIKELIRKTFQFENAFGKELAIHMDMATAAGDTYWRSEEEDAELKMIENEDGDKEYDTGQELYSFICRLQQISEEGNKISMRRDM